MALAVDYLTRGHPRPAGQAARARSTRGARTCSWSAAAIPATTASAPASGRAVSPSRNWKCCPPRPRSATKNNPWPEWPRVLRTDYGQMEAIAAQGGDPRLFETTVERVLAGESGHVCAVETVRVARGADGRLHPVEGTRRTLPCQLLLIAAGFVGCEAETAETLPLLPERPQRSPTSPPAAHRVSPRPVRRRRHARRPVAGGARPRRWPRRRQGSAPLARCSGTLTAIILTENTDERRPGCAR